MDIILRQLCYKYNHLSYGTYGVPSLHVNGSGEADLTTKT